MELRALKSISALAPISRGFTVNGLTIENVETTKKRGLYAYWQPVRDKVRGEIKNREVGQQPEYRKSKVTVKRESGVSGITIEGSKKRARSKDRKATEGTREDTEGRNKRSSGNSFARKDQGDRREGIEVEEGGPLVGGPHRCGARRGQSAAA